MIVTQGNNWQSDAACLVSAAVILIILRGGNMSSDTRKLLAIGLTGAVAALIVDGYLKPKMLP